MAESNVSPYVRVKMRLPSGWDKSKRGGNPKGTFSFRDSDNKPIILGFEGNENTRVVHEANMARGLYDRYATKLQIVGDAASGSNQLTDVSRVFLPGNFPFRDLLTGAGIATLGQIPSGKGSVNALMETIPGLTKEQGFAIVRSAKLTSDVATAIQMGTSDKSALSKIEYPDFKAATDPKDPDEEETTTEE